jgi:hypothetical protein
MVWQGDTYEEICRNFRWEFPEYFNIGVDICDKWAEDKYRLALIYLDEDEREHKITYWELKNASRFKSHGKCVTGTRCHPRGPHRDIDGSCPGDLNFPYRRLQIGRHPGAHDPALWAPGDRISP